MHSGTLAALQLLVFSDTHSNPGPMLDVLAAHRGAAACFFLGDGGSVLPLARGMFPGLPIYSVRGNCDHAENEPMEGLAPMGGVLFYYTHGHTLGVKQGLDQLWQAAKRNGADAALFGHTHAPVSRQQGGVHLFNPGSIGQPRVGPPTYGLITAWDGFAHYEVKTYEG